MDKKLKAPKEIVLCQQPDCKCWQPYHLKTCSVISGKYCRECGARKPRHYPACAQDTIKFNRWWIPEYMQKEVMEAYLLMKEEAQHKGIYREPPKIEPEVRYPNEHNVNPIVGQRIIKAIFMMLESNSHEDMLITKKTIFAEIEKIAGRQRSETQT